MTRVQFHMKSMHSLGRVIEEEKKEQMLAQVPICPLKIMDVDFT